MKTRGAFTLLETLAAVAVLALMAGAALPLMTRLAHGQIQLDDERRARELLAGMNPEQLAQALATGPVRLQAEKTSETSAAPSSKEPHPSANALGECWLRAAILTPNHDPAADAYATSPKRRWARVEVSDSPTGGRVLAKAVMLAPLASTPPATGAAK